MLTFLCPNGHEIKVRHLHYQSLGSMKELDAQDFALHCPQCKWEGMLKGHQRESIQQAE